MVSVESSGFRQGLLTLYLIKKKVADVFLLKLRKDLLEMNSPELTFISTPRCTGRPAAAISIASIAVHNRLLRRCL